MTTKTSINPTGEEQTTNVGECSKRQEAFVVFGMLLILTAVIGIVVWQTDLLINSGLQKDSSPVINRSLTWPIFVNNMVIYEDLGIEIGNGTDILLVGKLGGNAFNGSIFPNDCSKKRQTDVCLEWDNNRILMVNYTTTPVNVGGVPSELGCYDIEWVALGCINQVFTDCINITSLHWYGGYADQYQYWPFEQNKRTITAYVANDSYAGEIGGVIERYFISSSGVGIYVDEDVPLYFSLNHPGNGSMCYIAKYDKYPYFNDGSVYPTLKYKICQGSNVKDVHSKMSSAFIPKPSGIPDTQLFRYPIWSTWAQYHKDINQTTVLEFANNILKYNFTHAQLEIDDDWTPSYGDMTFDLNKFPNATEMVKQLNDLGFAVTIWVHPFFNVDSNAFKQAAEFFFLMRSFEGQVPALTPWWDGLLAGILDVSNPDAVDWFLGQLDSLKTEYNISSFKFDAGETSWLPHIYSATSMPTNPAKNYPQKWVELAAKADDTYHQEVRAGYRTQSYPVFVRMMDKRSNWGHNNALKSIIPCVLTYGILGYPFVLPDMIGGNAYSSHPDPELYIRWLQLNTFLPSMQYSIVPWIYNDTVLEITQKFTKMHENVSDSLIKFANQAVETGEPIIRPLWWIAPMDEVALRCEDEYLLGDEYLVAPVVEAGARSRDIYLPEGSWLDQLRGDLITGPIWKRGYTVDIDELAYFVKI